MEKGTYVYGGEIAAGVDMFLKDKDEIKCGNFVIECIEDSRTHSRGTLF